MVRYAHDTAVYDDLTLRKVPLQNANVIVHIKHGALDNSRHVECLLDGYGIIHNSTHSANERLRGWQLRDIILKASRSGWQASRNTKIVLIRAGSTEILKLSLLVWIPPDFGHPRADESCLLGTPSAHLKKRPSAANDMQDHKKPTSVASDVREVKMRPSAATETRGVKKRQLQRVTFKKSRCAFLRQVILVRCRSAHMRRLKLERYGNVLLLLQKYFKCKVQQR
jgi:hypothetical protein